MKVSIWKWWTIYFWEIPRMDQTIYNEWGKSERVPPLIYTARELQHRGRLSLSRHDWCLWEGVGRLFWNVWERTVSVQGHTQVLCGGQRGRQGGYVCHCRHHDVRMCRNHLQVLCWPPLPFLYPAQQSQWYSHSVADSPSLSKWLALHVAFLLCPTDPLFLWHFTMCLKSKIILVTIQNKGLNFEVLPKEIHHISIGPNFYIIKVKIMYYCL